MGHQSAGNPAAYPVSFLVPDDGDPKTAASYNVGLQALSDRTAYLSKKQTTSLAVFTSSGTWTAPTGCTSVTIDACGGGGGGGGSGAAGIVAANSGCGGGGGAGAMRGLRTIPVSPGVTYTITIGAGGAGGVVGSPGVDGTPTTFAGTSVNELWQGGGGGGCTSSLRESTTSYVYGGSPVSVSVFWKVGDHAGSIADKVNTIQLTPGSGGAALNALFVSYSNAGTGSGSNVGGPGGGSGAAGGSYQGGGGGGGGGAGPYGPGATAGTGGTGDPAGGSIATYSGAPGAAAAANSGAGGGGQGGAGSTANNTGNSNNGGAGGSGKLTIVYTSVAVP